MNIEIRDIVTAATFVGCVVALAKYKKLSGKYEQAIDNIADGINIDISNDIINAAVDRAVTKEAASQVNMACTKAVNAVRSDISEAVKKAVNAEKASISENTKKEIAKKISEIDISEAKGQVIKKAQEIVADRLEEDTKAIAGTYEASIKKVADMCETMISTATISAQKAKEPVRVNDVKTIIRLFEEG